MTAVDTRIEVRRNGDNEPECDWGVIEHRQFHHGGAGHAHLILVRRDAVAKIVAADKPLFDGRAWATVTIRHPDPCLCVCIECITGAHCDRPTCAQPDNDTPPRIFFHLDYREDDQQLTWELFEARWWDNTGPEIYVGRWPD
ncbi:hypothetical protein [Mycobacterium sp. PSTR-4-N]|uniref:hypothetical protein n=1 Tax=Mycobacterium sp. PSTR-4-N TaxID=2917745 RepID=UPI001F153F6B|nr:hypothetical protein [Mycobacterium sp. PSTR-4-N]MCG7592411.1 hypothetical protein [Mycobacterium sp. PSTR-4-N]